MSAAPRIETVPVELRHRLFTLPGTKPNALEEFIHLPHRLYRNDPLYTPLLNMEQGELLDRKHHPFYQPDSIGSESFPGAEAEFFLARRDGRVVGRIAAIVNHIHNAFEQRKTGQPAHHGFFGFFESEPDYAIAEALLDSAASWLRARGLNEIYGPASPSHNYYFGSRRTSAEKHPTPSKIFEAHNHDYYNDFYERWGMTVARRLFGYTVDIEHDERAKALAARHARGMTELKSKLGITIRPLNMRDFDAELGRANDLINKTLELNWGYSPMTLGELKATADSMRLLVEPELVLIAEVDGNPVGIALGLPDYNEIFQRMGGRLRKGYELLRFSNSPLAKRLGPLRSLVASRQLTGARIIALGVVPTIQREGVNIPRQLMRLGPALMYQLWEAGHRLGFREMTASWVLEDNKAMNAPFQLIGKEPDRIWVVWHRSLETTKALAKRSRDDAQAGAKKQQLGNNRGRGEEPG